MLSMGNNVKISTGFMGGGISGAISAGMSGELLKTTFTNKVRHLSQPHSRGAVHCR